MQNPKFTLPRTDATAVPTLKPAHKGLYLVSRNSPPAIGKAAATQVQTRPSDAPNDSEPSVMPAGEIFRMKLAACFGAVLTAPVVWCLHTVLLSFHTR